MTNDDLDQITRLHRLKQDGLLTEQEFDAEKARILSGATQAASMSAAAPPDTPRSLASEPVDPEPRRGVASIGVVAAAVILFALVGTGAWWFFAGPHGLPPSSNPSATAASNVPSAIDPSTAPPIAASAVAPVGTSNYQWATSTEALGITPEFLKSKLGIARVQNSDSVEFTVAGCDIRYGLKGETVTYFDAEVSANCKPSLRGLNVASSADFPRSRTIGQVEDKAGGLVIADCLEMCGNAADPAQYLFIEGPHSDNFINVAFEADPRSSRGLDKWANAIRATKGLKPEDELPEQSYQCGSDAQDAALAAIGPTPISRVFVGLGVTTKMLTLCSGG